MTKVKKMLGMVMAALMCFALTPAAAFAADEMGSLKVENAVEGQTYSLYKIADLKVSGTDLASYSYTPAAGWEDFWDNVATDNNQYGISLVAGNIVFNGTSMNNDDDTVAALAVAAKNWSPKPNATQTETAGKKGVTFTGLQLGYYFLDSTTGTICSLTSMKPNDTISEKNDFPTIEKTVKENSTEQYGPNNNASIGDTVEFRTVIDVAKGALNYVYHDAMTEGLTFNADSVKVYLGDGTGAPLGNALEIDVAYTLSVAPSTEAAHGDNWTAGACDFEVAFDQAWLGNLTEDDYIVIEYTALLNEDAKILENSNDNTANLTYGDNNTTTNESQTKTYTGQMDVLKHNDANEGLAGAVFTLSAKAADADAITLVQIASYDPEVAGTQDIYRPALPGEEGTFTEIVTNDTGAFSIIGLDEGKYYLTEITAPEGYNKLAQAQEVIVTDNATNVVSLAKAKVLNKAGLELPSTGGIGTMILYVIGGLLVLGAIVVLVRRRSSAK